MSRITELQREVEEIKHNVNAFIKHFDKAATLRIEELVASEIAKQTPPQVEKKEKGDQCGN